MVTGSVFANTKSKGVDSSQRAMTCVAKVLPWKGVLNSKKVFLSGDGVMPVTGLDQSQQAVSFGINQFVSFCIVRYRNRKRGAS